MNIYEYDEELHMKSEREIWYNTGKEEGHETGLAEGREQGESRLNRLNAILIGSDRLDDLKRATQDKTYQEQLMAELLPGEMQNI